MHKVTFFPLGNADCCRIDLHDGRKILFDFGNMRDPDDENDKRCDLPTLLDEDLKSAEKRAMKSWRSHISMTTMSKGLCPEFC